jgi:tetratricopeptide (TPR) repeat protein
MHVVRKVVTMIKKILLFLLLASPVAVWAQSYSQQYSNAKDLFQQGKYNLAMEVFKKLIPYDQRNPYSEYASFYYAIAAYKQNYKAVAKDMLLQIKSTHSQWDKMDEVNFWLGKIHMENGDYFQGLKVFSAIAGKHFEKDIEAAKARIASLTDVETLRMMHEEYPKDPVIGKAFAVALSKNSRSAEDEKLLENLIHHFNLKRNELIAEAPKTFHKEKYSVSVMLPFLVNTLEPSPGKKRNQIVLDFYEGMKLANDTLAKQGVNISLRAYDTQRSTEQIKRLLNTEELKTTDLIVGPFFPEENKIVQEFSKANKINVVHPFSNSSDIIGDNPYAFLFQPSGETLGRRSAEYLASRVTRKNSMVFYGPNKKDSVMAFNFAKTAAEMGLNVVHVEKIYSRDAGKLLETLATPTEFDEFKYPSQFTIKKDSIGSIYVASDDALIYTKVVTAIETRADSIKLVGSENWLDDSAVDPEKYQTLKIALTAPNFADPAKFNNRVFYRRFVKKYGRTPSPVARMGYEFMLFFGKQLKQNGVFFQEGLSKAGVVPGFLFEGFNFQRSRDNAFVPIITLQNGELTLLEKK